MNVKRLGLAAGLGIAAFVIFTQVKKLGTPAPVQTVVEAPAPVVEKVQYDNVLVATAEIPFGTRINETHFSWKQWPSEAVTPEFITQENSPQAIEEFTGGVAKSIIYQNEPVSERKIVKPGSQGLMASLLNPGMRAVTTRISVDTAAGGFIQPGDHVDIILTSAATTTTPGIGGRGNTFVSTTIFENVRVLAIDQTISTSAESGAAIMGSTATFEMTQDDSELLQQAVAQGDLSLTLRPMVGSYSSRGKSHAKIARNSDSQTSLTVYRNGQPQQVAIRE